jgi:hypothetical protein
LTPQELEELWVVLAGGDAVKAYRAIGRLSDSPQSAVRFLGRQLQLAPPDAKVIARLIAELDDDRYQVRERATRQLAHLGSTAEAALKWALAGKPSVEARRRLEGLLRPLEELEMPPAQLRIWRAIEVLEHIGSPDAQHVLRELTKSHQAQRLTREAKAALARLVQRASIP